MYYRDPLGALLLRFCESPDEENSLDKFSSSLLRAAVMKCLLCAEVVLAGLLLLHVLKINFKNIFKTIIV